MDHISQRRIDFEQLGNIYSPAEGVARQDTIIGGIPCVWFYPEGSEVNKHLLIYLHGGAFFMGSAASHAAMVTHIAKYTGQRVLFIDYRRSPEHPFPAGLNDIVQVLEVLLQEGVDTYGMIGDSAGGNLTLVTQLQLRSKGIQGPQYSIVISPWTDLQCKNESYMRNATIDVVLAKPFLQDAAAIYADGHSLDEALLSPVNAKFDDFAPVLILCGTNEILEDDSRYLYQRLIESGVTASLVLFEGALHVWPQQDIYAADSERALRLIQSFISQYATK